jgi:hypothetical protein
MARLADRANRKFIVAAALGWSLMTALSEAAVGFCRSSSAHRRGHG